MVAATRGVLRPHRHQPIVDESEPISKKLENVEEIYTPASNKDSYCERSLDTLLSATSVCIQPKPPAGSI